MVPKIIDLIWKYYRRCKYLHDSKTSKGSPFGEALVSTLRDIRQEGQYYATIDSGTKQMSLWNLFVPLITSLVTLIKVFEPSSSHVDFRFQNGS
jgi:hypothetical protein